MAEGIIHLYRRVGTEKSLPVIAHAEVNLKDGSRITWIETPGEPRWGPSSAKAFGEQLVTAADVAGELLNEALAIYGRKEPHPHG